MKLKIYAVSFISGACVMALEIASSRFVAPYFGTSLFVWTNAIGIVMLALAAGYFLGGRLSEKSSQERNLFRIIAVAGGLVVVIPYAGAPLSGFIIDKVLFAPPSLIAFIGSFFAILFLFAIPIALLGMVSPFLIKLSSNGRADVGALAGNLFAIGTFGSLLGTFLPTLVLIPVLGTKLTISILGSVLLVMGLAGLISKSKFKAFSILALALPMVYSPPPEGDGLIFKTESPFQEIRVYDRADGGRELRFNEGIGVQSLMVPDGFVGTGYWDYPTAFFMLRAELPKRVAILGLAGGTISRSASLQYPGADFQIDGVEIDSKVIKAAEDYFDLKRDNLNIYNADGRAFIEQTENKYDLIFVDAYANQLYIPFHMASKEFFRSLKEKINPDGVAAMNINAVSFSSPLLRAIANTLSSEFPYVQVVSIPESYNFMILGSITPIDLKEVAGRLPAKFSDIAYALQNRSREWNYSGEERVLTDDKAPIELMTDALFFEALGLKLKQF